MTADTITTTRINELFVLLDMAAYRLKAMVRESETGTISTAEAAEEINEIIVNINAANQ